MQIIAGKRQVGLFVSILLIFFMLTPLIAQEKKKISGKMTVAATKQEMVDIGDTKGHTVGFSIFEGTNFSTGAQKFMDGAHATNVAFGDFVMGSGPHQTYVTITQNDNAAIARCEGKSKATPSPDGTMMVTFEGTFTYVGGKGAFENIQGKGTYKGKYLAKNIYTAEWEGEYFIKK